MAARKQDPKPAEDKAAPAAPPRKTGEPVDVELEPETPEDDAPEPGEAPEAALSRREKKRERQTLREQAEADREARLAAERAAGQAIGYAQAMAQQQYAQQQGQRKDPLEEEADAIFRERDLLVTEYQQAKQRAGQTGLTAEQERDFKQRGFNLERRLATNSAKAAMGQQPPQQNQVVTFLQARYPDVMQNQEAVRWAFARYQTLINDPQDRHPDDVGTVDKVMDEARERWGMGGRRQQTETRPETRRFAGSAAGASGSRATEASRPQLTAEQATLADAAYPDLPPKERYKRYWQVIERDRQRRAS